MLTLDDSQADLSNRSALVPIPLVVFTTYTNRDSGTVDNIYYWSSVPVHYNWNAAGDKYFRDVIRSIGMIEHSMPHLTIAGGNRAGHPSVRFEIANDTIAGTALWKTLKNDNLIYSTIEYAEILVNPDLIGVAGGSDWWDLRDLAGDEHVYRFRGDFIECDIIEDDHNFSMLFQTPDPEVPLVELLSPDENDPRDFGGFLPIVYGHAKRVPCKNVLIGWLTTLAESLLPASTGLAKVLDATGFPTGTAFDVMIGNEVITCSGSDHTSHTITITSRAQDGTKAAAHIQGDVVIEMVDEVKVGIAGHACVDIPFLYVANPYNQTLMRFIQAYELRLNDKGAITGQTICTATIARSDMIDFLTSAQVSARVSVQPDFETVAAASTEEETPDSFSVLPSGSPWSKGDWYDSGVTPEWVGIPYGYPPELMKGEFTGVYNATDEVKSWNLHLDATLSGWTGGPAEMWLYAYNVPGIPFGTGIHVRATGNGTYSEESRNYEPPSGTVMEDLDTDGAYFILAQIGQTNETWVVNEWTIQARTEPGSATIYQIVDAEIQAGSTGFGLQFFADVDGYGVPYSYAAPGATGYSFDEGTLWNTSGGTQYSDTAGKIEGTAAQRLTASATTSVMQRTSTPVGTVNLETTDDLYRISIYCNDLSLITSARVWFSNTTGSGTTPPTDRRQLTIPIDFLLEDTWVTLDIVADIYGSTSADIDNVETVGLEFTSSSGTPYMMLDDLRVASAANANYDDAPGTLIEKMPDITRHFIAEHCGLGHSVIDDTTFDLALTRLGSNVYAGPVTVYGTTFDEILAGMAFEGRANIVREESSSGALYKFHTAINTTGVFTYTAAVRTLDEWNHLRERTHMAGSISNRFRAFWAWDPFLGYASDAFTQVTRADKDTNDTQVTTVSFTLSELAIGTRNADSYPFYLIQDETTAEDVLGFYAYENVVELGNRVEWELIVPHWLGYDLERGDIVALTPSWDVSTQKARVTRIRREFQIPAVTLTLVEVGAA